MKQIKDLPKQSSMKAYKTWFDKRHRVLVTYDSHWKKEDWDNLVYIGQLQPHQNSFRQDEKGIYRKLWGRKVYYFEF